MKNETPRKAQRITITRMTPVTFAVRVAIKKSGGKYDQPVCPN